MGDIGWPQDKIFGTTEVELWKLGLLRSMFCCRRGRSGGWPSVKWILVDRELVELLRPIASARLQVNYQRPFVPQHFFGRDIPHKATASAELNSIQSTFRQQNEVNPHCGYVRATKEAIGAYKHRLAFHLSHLVAEQKLGEDHASRP